MCRDPRTSQAGAQPIFHASYPEPIYVSWVELAETRTRRSRHRGLQTGRAVSRDRQGRSQRMSSSYDGISMGDSRLRQGLALPSVLSSIACQLHQRLQTASPRSRRENKLSIKG